MEIEQLEAFVAVADRGSVLAAADALGLPRSTVRAKVAALELEVGVPLLIRTRDGAVLTGQGQTLLDHARDVVTQVRALPALVREGGEIPLGELHVRAPLGMPPEIAGLLVAEFRARHPHVTLRLSFAEEPVAPLPADADLVLHFGPTVPRGAFRTHVLLHMREQLVASRSYLAESGVPASVADLAPHTLLLWRAPGDDGRTLPTLSGQLVPVRPAVVSSDIHQLRMMAAAGAGIAFLPNPQLQTALADDDLVPVLTDEIGRDCALRLVIPEVQAQRPGTRAAVALMRELVMGTFGFAAESTF